MFSGEEILRKEILFIDLVLTRLTSLLSSVNRKHIGLGMRGKIIEMVDGIVQPTREIIAAGELYGISFHVLPRLEKDLLEIENQHRANIEKLLYEEKEGGTS